MVRRANHLALTKIVPKVGSKLGPLVAWLSLATFAASCRTSDGSSGKSEANGFAPQELLDRLAEVARSAPPAQARRGDRKVTGRVVTDRGEPLAGVTIRATSIEYPMEHVTRHAFEDAPHDVPLARVLAGEARYWYWRETGTRETTTAADGTFVFENLPAEQLSLEGHRKDFYLEPVGLSWDGRITVTESTTVDFVAFPCVRQQFELHLPDGSSPKRAKLNLERFGNRHRSDWESWTSTEPAIPLPAGDWTVNAVVEGDEPQILSTDSGWFNSRPIHFTVDPAHAIDVVRIDLLGNSVIEGTIVESSSPTRSQVSVVALMLEPDETPDPKLFDDAAQSRRRSPVHRESPQWTSTTRSAYRIARVEPGRWLVGLLDYRNETPLASAVVEVGHAVARHDFTLPPAPPDDELRVRVVDPDGVVLRDCVLESTCLVHSQNGMTFRNGGDAGARGTLEGAFALSRATLGEECVLFVEHPRFGVAWIEVPADSRALELQFAAAAVPTLRLTGYAEHAGHRRVRVEATRLVDPKFERGAIAFDATAIGADGAVELGRLQPGTWQVRVFVDSDRRRGPDGYEVATTTVELASGARDVELPFPALSALQIAVAPKSRQGLELIPVTATSADDRRLRRYVEADSDGLVTFPDVPPGLYEIVSQGDRHMVVEAPARKPIAFVAEAVNALRVVIVDPNGALAKLGLQSGDAIVAVDGREFENRQQLDWIRQSLHGDEVTLTVQRADKLFEVVVPRTFLKDDRAAGGRLREGAR